MTENREWIVQDLGFQEAKVEARGSKFFMGNGYLGFRGTLEEFGAKERVACTLAGVYDRVGSAWREPVNAPNGLWAELAHQGRPLNPLKRQAAAHAQGLDLRQGLHFAGQPSRCPGGIASKCRRSASPAWPIPTCFASVTVFGLRRIACSALGPGSTARSGISMGPTWPALACRPHRSYCAPWRPLRRGAGWPWLNPCPATWGPNGGGTAAVFGPVNSR